MKFWKNFCKFSLCFGFAFVMIFSFGCSPTGDGEGGPNSDPNSNNFNGNTSYTTPIDIQSGDSRADIVEDYMHAIASIYYETTATDGKKSQSFNGSGVAVYAGGYIATNWHVISEVVYYPNKYNLKVEIWDGEEFEMHDAQLLWENINFDLAILKCEYANIPYVEMADRWIDTDDRIRAAEEVWTLGSPYSESLFGTYSSGYVSSPLERVSIASDRVYESLIQHSANISNGSSGSGLFDSAGKLIGLNTLGINSTSAKAANGLFFATPIFPIINIIGEISTLAEDNDPHTKYSFPAIGVTGHDSVMAEYYADLNDFEDKGVYVASVSNPGACLGKLAAGDFIVGLCDKDANEESDSFFKIEKRNDLLYALSKYSSGDEIKIYYKRGSTYNNVIITLG